MEQDLDLLVRSRFLNLRLWEKMNGRGAKQAARDCGVDYGTFRNLLMLKISPYKGMRGPKQSPQTEEYRSAALKIACHYSERPEKLFPDTLYSLALPDVFERRYSSAEIVPLLAARNIHDVNMLPDETCESHELAAVIEKVMKELSPREARVLRLRFGLQGEWAHTLNEVAAIFGITPPRIRQIEQRALQKLRRYNQSNRLIIFRDQDERDEWKRTYGHALFRRNP